MSIQNEEILEELMWIAYENDKAIELVELAGSFIMKDGFSRIQAYERAFNELGLVIPDNIQI